VRSHGLFVQSQDLERQLSQLMANGSSPEARLPQWRDRVARVQEDLRNARQEYAELSDVLGKRVCSDTQRTVVYTGSHSSYGYSFEQC